MIKKILASRNTYELVNNRTIREQTSSRDPPMGNEYYFYRKFLKGRILTNKYSSI